MVMLMLVALVLHPQHVACLALEYGTAQPWDPDLQLVVLLVVLVEVLVVLVLLLTVVVVVVPPLALAAAVVAGCLPLAASLEAAAAASVPHAVVAAVAVPSLQCPLALPPFSHHGLPVLAGAMLLPQPVWLPSIGHPG